MKSNCNKCIHKEMCKYKDGIKSEDIFVCRIQERSHPKKRIGSHRHSIGVSPA